MAVITLLSPGPGVLKSVTNSLNYGLRRAMIGVAGLATGVFCVAALCATSLGALLAASPAMFWLVRIAGAAYLVYLGIKLWRAAGLAVNRESGQMKSHRALFVEGWLLQFSNPNGIFFFLSVLPQFIDHHSRYLPQLTLLVLTFCGLLILVHSGYAGFAGQLQRWAGQGRSGQWLNRLGGLVFILFGVLLLKPMF
ncbi:amino acid transporter LysE [Silvimonas amylolytica]|uniref:Amino acid transporter LysE n=2 Tax=Silvimonas amylolytica TaxID=449663 RepID=A0ABQ2PQ63_9NEIS|nr:amino acid transporter LysE [Silvimonas amylolytica]